MSEQKILKQKLLHLYSQQTSEERMADETIEDNGRGFNGIDANILSSFSRQVLARKSLSEKQINLMRKLLPKYHRQYESGAWQEVVVPEPVAYTPKPLAQNRLYLDPKTGGLIFSPITYPSKQIKNIGPFYWKDKAWHQAKPVVNRPIVERICEMFPEVQVSDEVWDIVDIPAVELPEEVAEHKTLFDFQKEAIQFSLTAERGMLCLAPGLGKTVVAIMAAQAAGCQRILIIAPLSLLQNWKNEIRKWVDQDAEIVHRKVPATFTDRSKWTITNYDTLRLQPEKFMQHWWDAIIIDETIMIKNRKAKRTKVVKKLLDTAKPKYSWLLSGAPTSRLYNDLWAQLNTIYPKRFSSYWRFAEQYCYVVRDQWGWHITANKEDAAEEIQKDLSDIYFARTQDQVLDLPPWIFDNIEVPMGKQQQKLYAQMEGDFLSELSESDVLVAPNILAQLTRLIQLASNPALVDGIDQAPKWSAAIEMLEYEELPAIIWTNYIETAEQLQHKLKAAGYTVGVLTGKTATTERQEVVDKFQNGETQVLIAHPAVGKFGFTLTAARTAIYLERSYNGDDYYQSLHRVRRIGTVYSPHVIHLMSTYINGNPTVDYVIDRVLEARRDDSIALTTGELRGLFGGGK